MLSLDCENLFYLKPYLQELEQLHRSTASSTHMAVAIEHSFSASVIRPPLASAEAPSVADSLPSANFGFDDLRDRMARFTVRFDDFIEKGRKRVLEERNQFRMNVAELQGTESLTKLYATTQLMLFL